MAYKLTGEILSVGQLMGIGLVLVGVLALELGRTRSA
jgi:multidrug transporter EmrE-like cation transporter